MRLEIVIACDCHGCEQARAIALELREMFPALNVDLIELDGQRAVPSGVVATPTYLLDGAVISLGNPRRGELIEALALRLEPASKAQRTQRPQRSP